MSFVTLESETPLINKHSPSSNKALSTVKAKCTSCLAADRSPALDDGDESSDEAIVRRFFPKRLLLYTLIGAASGILLGIILATSGASKTVIKVVGFPGEILMRMLRALVLPLIICSVVCSIASLPVRHTGRLAVKTMVFFVCSMLQAATVGILVSLALIVTDEKADILPTPTSSSNIRTVSSPLDAALNMIRDMFPKNLVVAASEFNVLGLMVFSFVTGIVLPRLGSSGEPLLGVIRSMNKLTMALIGIVLHYGPFGICSLVAGKMGEDDQIVKKLEQLLSYVAAVVLGLAIQMLVFLPIYYAVFARKNPIRFYQKMMPAALVAFSTGSSAATIPVTLKCVESSGVSPSVAQFVIPLSANINMCGTALYEATAVIFIATTYGVDLNISQLIIIALTATMAAMGAAAIPEAGLFTMVLVLTAVGLPTEGVGLIISVDWILDRIRTVANVLGDSVCAAIVDHPSYREVASPNVVESHSGDSMVVDNKRDTKHTDDNNDDDNDDNDDNDDDNSRTNENSK